MKKIIIAMCITAIILTAAVIIYSSLKPPSYFAKGGSQFGETMGYVDPSFAGEVVLRTGRSGESVTITNEQDIEILKQNLTGDVYYWDPACPIYDSDSITFNGRIRSVTVYPALDGCGIARVGNGQGYVDIVDMDAVEEVLGKYGITVY